MSTKHPISKAPAPPSCIGGWLPRDHGILQAWLKGLVTHVDKHPKELHPVIKEFQAFIEKDSTNYMLFHQMFEQIPLKDPYFHDPTGCKQVRNYKHMLALFNHILTSAPQWSNAAYKVGLIGFPINTILDWPMGTPAGQTAFLMPSVNAMFKRMFRVWAQYLSSSDSASVLTKDADGWFGPDASVAMPGFVEMFECDPDLPAYGYTSWDDFFTRTFRPNVRPIADPTDDNVIVSACESAPLRVAKHVKARDTFWLKEQPYSLLDMLAQDELAPQFIGGTVYQAFLSATSYHRWHAPLSGTVVKIVPIEGTFYSEPPSEGFPTPDPGAPNLSQAYICQVATRTMIFVEADNTAIGLMCIMTVGMAEVSTCQVTVEKGQRITKGEEIGMFHFGGSTHCLIFRPSVDLEFDLHGQTPGVDAKNIEVLSKLATVK